MGSPHIDIRSFPTLDISAFEGSNTEASTKIAKELVAICHAYGFLAIRGHGLSNKSLEDGFEIMRQFFALPNEDKMKAPHPPGPKPHRGFSGLGVEKVYSEKDMEAANQDASILRQVKDYKESYEIGSEKDQVQPNIWIPDEVMPTFKPFMLRFYEELDQVASKILRAFAVGLELNSPEREELLQLDSHEENQLRLLYYPAVSQSELGKTVLSRLPTHIDYSAFTMLFQDKTGGLEFKHPGTGVYHLAKETDDLLFLNVGMIMQHLTNDYFIAAEHRVTLPSDASVVESGLTARYSIPYFVCPRHDYMTKTLDRFVTAKRPGRHESVRFDEYWASIAEFQYAGEEL